MSDLPCEKAIGKACFKAFPEFAKRAIAYRLLHLLIPPEIAKLLPKQLADPLIAPGVKVPLDAKFPPGTCVVPGCDFPAGWDPKSEPPACTKSAPLPPIAMVAGGANPNVMVAPGPSGPLPPSPPPPPPPEDEAWFYDSFDTLDLGVWTKVVDAGVTIEATGGRLLYTIGSLGADGEIQRDESRSYPTDIDISFNLEVSGTYVEFSHYVDIGSYSVSVQFWRGVKIRIMETGGWVDHAVADFRDADVSWTLKVRSNLLSIFKNDVEIISDRAMTASNVGPKNMRLNMLHTGTGYLDEYTITEI